MGCGSKVTNVIKKVTNTVVDVVKDTTKIIVSDIGSKLLKTTGSLLSDIGIKQGKELTRIGNQLDQIGKVLTGEYHESVKAIQAQEDKLNTLKEEYYNLADEINGEAFLGEIFSIAGSNTLDRYVSEKILPAEEQYKKMLDNFKKEFSYILDWAEGSFFERLFASFILIIGGLLNDIGDIVTGKANSETWKNIITTVLSIAAIVILLPVAPWASIILIANLIITLDAAYANGAMLGAIFSLLDFVFNDVLNLDDLVAKDFDHFNKDSEYYQETQAYFKLALAISAVVSSLYSVSNLPDGALKTTMANMGLSSSTISNVGTITEAYNAYNVAISVNDIITMNDKYNEMYSDLKEKQNILDNRINSANRRKMIGSYIDMEHILAYPDEMVNEYVMQMTQLNNGVLDPEGLISMNTRYKVENQDMTFGFEDIFAYDNQAGGNRYTKQILFKTY
ncbi:MAG: hypothetical protein PHV52_00220 [Aliarcobacter sp.]|nr:hypothetical protein [Aliarcobacter sp.]